jgi:hypothetical protein
MKTTRGRWSYRSKEIEVMNATYHGSEKFPLPGPAIGAALVLCALLGVGPQLCLAGPSSQLTFPSPDEAGRALVSAVQDHDEGAVTKILGGGHELIGADDQTEESLERERFVQKYQEMHRWVRESGGMRTLYIGAENWPFPIPLMSRNGKWRFDSKAGSEEILFRRIGENEVTAIHVCETLGTAKTHPGTDSEADGLVKALLPQAQGAGGAIPMHGYYFRILQNSGGGFAAIAYPAVYRSSGVKAFILTPEGGVFEKDLGADTAKIAAAMTDARIDSTWTPAESKP